MVHKRGLGSLPKGLEWIEPRLDLEENTVPAPSPEPARPPFPKPTDIKPVIPIQATTVSPKQEESPELQAALAMPELQIPASPVSAKSAPQKKTTASIHTAQKAEEPDSSTSLKGLKEGWTRATFIVKEEQVEKLKAVAYWERITVKEVIEEAFTLYLQNKNVRKIPDRSRS